MKVYNPSNDVLTMETEQTGHMLVSFNIINYIHIECWDSIKARPVMADGSNNSYEKQS